MMHRLTTLILALILCGDLSASVCNAELSAIVHAYRQGLVGEIEDPYRTALGKMDTDIDIRELESDAFSLIENEPPESRNLKGFADKYGFAREQAQDIVNYYALLFYGDLNLAGEKRDILSRVSHLDRIYFLNRSEDPLVRRHRYYLANLTQLAVPEMAKTLGISEGQVYSELSFLRLSIPDAFEERHIPERAKALIDSGRSVEGTAQELGVGPQALTFVLHHYGSVNRGVQWDRVLLYQGHSSWETQILVDLYERGLSHSEIADRLNQLAGAHGPTDPDLRTQQSVAKKLKELGLSQTIDARFPASKEIDGYGLVKNANRLLPSTVQIFLWDNYDKPVPWLAEQLGVTEDGLKEFMKRHHILLDTERRSASASGIQARYTEKRGLRSGAIQNFINVVRRLDNKLPRAPSKKKGQQLSEEQDAQKRAYQWLYYNYSNVKTIEKLPADIQGLVGEWKPLDQARIAVENFANAVRANKGQLPRQIERRKGEKLSEEQVLQAKAYAWLAYNHDNADAIAKLPPDLQALVRSWKPLDTTQIAIDNFIEAVRLNNGKLPSSRARRKEAKLAEGQSIQKNAYQWLGRNYKNADAIAKLPADIQVLVREWKPAALDKGAVDNIVKVLRRNNGMLPRTYRRVRGQKISEEQNAENNAYNWLTKHYADEALVAKLPADLQETVRNFRPVNAMQAGLDNFIMVVRSNNGELPSTKRAKYGQDSAETKRAKKNAYSWLRNNYNKPDAVAKLPEDIQALVRNWVPN